MEKFKQDAEFWAWQAEIEKEEQRYTSDTGNDDSVEKKNSSSSVIGPQRGGRKFHEDWDQREQEEEEKARKLREVLHSKNFKVSSFISFKKSQ